MDKSEFEPRLGRTRAGGSKQGRKYLGAVVRAAARAGMQRGAKRSGFTGSKFGRGGVAARILVVPDRYSGFRTRRGAVKTRIVRLGFTGIAAAGAHLRYIQRDGVSREGEAGRLYSAVEDDADAKAFLARSDGDRHQFRIIASADDGAEYDDLRPLIRRFMARVEKDLGTQLDWVAADHADTLRQHTHIVLRGREERGENLVISPAYMNYGMRERLAELVSIDLGPETDFEIQRRLGLDVAAERITSIDRRLIQAMDADGIVAIRGRDMFDHAIQVGRLRKLEALGLAGPVGGGRWQLANDLEPVLHTLGERGEVIQTMQRALCAAGIERARSEQLIFDPHRSRSITGRLVSRGLIGEALDRHYLIVDGIDGRSHHVEIGSSDTSEPVPDRSIVRVSSGSNGIEVELLSALPLERLVDHDGATWLDRELASPRDPARDAGFGREVRSALAFRRTWLVERGLASLEGEEVIYPPAMVEQLQRRELAHIRAAIGEGTGLRFAGSGEGVPIEGVVRRRLDLASGRFAMIEDGRSFSLVPWQPVFDRALGRTVRGVLCDGGISWAIGRHRGPEL